MRVNNPHSHATTQMSLRTRSKNGISEAYKHNDFTSQNRQKNIIGGSWKNTDTTMKTQV